MSSKNEWLSRFYHNLCVGLRLRAPESVLGDGVSKTPRGTIYGGSTSHEVAQGLLLIGQAWAMSNAPLTPEEHFTPITDEGMALSIPREPW